MATKKSTTETAIATFDYLRKSTKGETLAADGKKRERQEKSIQQQRDELDKLRFPQELELTGYTAFDVVSTHTDEGVSGWKMADRPGFQEMIAAIKAHPAQVKTIRLDNIDRFSRASIDETLEVARELKRAAVRWIVSAAQGVYAIGNGNDLVEHLKFAIAASASHEYSNQMSRRVSLSMRNKSSEGKRMGGAAPYGMKSDPSKLLVPGDPAQVAVVQQIFKLFVANHKSINWISRTLNAQGVPAPRGGRWQPEVVKRLLQQPAYCGRHVYGRQTVGRFHQIGADGELVKIGEEDFVEVHTRGGKRVRRPPTKQNDKPAVCREGAFAAIIDPKQFDAAQKRFGTFKTGRRPRHNGYALSGILKCAHCGGPLSAVTVNDGDVVYRCMSHSLEQRNRKCKSQQIRQDLILPAVLQLVDEEISAIQAAALAPTPPELPAKPNPADKIIALQKRIDNTLDAIMDTTHKQTRQGLDAKLTAMQNELEALQAQQNAPATDADTAAAAKLFAWWSSVRGSLVSAPVPANGPLAAGLAPGVVPLTMDWEAGVVRPRATLDVGIDRRAVNELLHALGASVDIQWRTVPGKLRDRHYPEVGRIRLGQRSGQLKPSSTIGWP